ncbi:MAG: endonuclease/exonuclease/phosphatase family protein [Sulfurovum sp.]
MLKLSVFLLLFFLNLFAKEFTIASYNVENLFDLKHQGSEYKEYIPFNKYNWNNETFNIKISNISKITNQIDADIIALQEIESEELMIALQKKLPQYKYYSFAKTPNSSIGLGFLSKLEIIKNNQINVNFKNRLYRPILESTFKIQNTSFSVFNNHWPSKRAKESYRIKFALALNSHIKKYQEDYDYILIGDFNSNYDEYKTLKYLKTLNDTQGLTGINDVLKTTNNNKLVLQEQLDKNNHYNLWLEIPLSKRFSLKFRGEYNTPDNIILPSALFDTKKISYIDNSFKVFTNEELYFNNKIYRWQRDYKKRHIGKGYSDHLPIIARFSTNSFINKDTTVQNAENKEIKISELYEKNTIDNYNILKDVVVIYKNKDNAIIKQKNNRAIYLYKCAKDLKLNHTYDLKVSKLDDFNGLKEIKKVTVLTKNTKLSNKELETLYLNGSKIDLNNSKYQNEIISNISGKIKNGFLINKTQKIKLYAKDKSLLPRNNENITILKAHLGTFRGKTQLNIYKKSDYLDYKVNTNAN